MTEKLLTFSFPIPPLIPPQTLGMGSIGQNSTFSRTASTQTNKDICTGTTCTESGFFFVVGGGGGGGGSRLLSPQLFLQFTEGVQWFYSTFSRGGGVQLFPRGGGPSANFYRNPYNYNLRFSRGVWTPYPPMDPHMDNVAFWHE